MSRATANDPPTDAQGFLDFVQNFVREEIGALRSEFEGTEAPVSLSEDQMDRLAARIASLSPSKPTVPFSGGTPLKKHSTPRTAYYYYYYYFKMNTTPNLYKRNKSCQLRKFGEHL